METAKKMNRVILETDSQCCEDCCICLSSFKNKTVAHLPCGHTFHHTCLMKQFKSPHHSATRCAMCRTDFLESMPEKQKNWKKKVNQYREILRNYRNMHFASNISLPTNDNDIIRDIIAMRRRQYSSQFVINNRGIELRSRIESSIQISPYRTMEFIDIPDVQENV